MSDLLPSLIAPYDPPESPRSFHSSQSRPSTPPPESSSNRHTVALQEAGLPIYDVDAFLNDPQNKSILSSIVKSSNTQKKIEKPGNESMGEPVQLGSPQTSHHVSALYHLCQERGLVPEFEIDGHELAGFGGWLKIDNEIIGSDEKWRTKKSAKEGLAAKGVEVVKGMQAKGKSHAVGTSEKNWVGLLVEYYSSPSHTLNQGGPNYIEYSIGTQFACTCTLPSHETLFGSKTLAFTTKKAARANAAKEAIEHLIAEGLTNPDGTVKARKKGKSGPSVKIDGKGLEVKRDATYAQKVSDLCPLLGLTAPTYRLTASSANAPILLSGAAYFAANPLFPGPVGDVRNVYGKKNAKEECARGVWEVLRGIARERGVEIEVGEDHRTIQPSGQPASPAQRRWHMVHDDDDDDNDNDND